MSVTKLPAAELGFNVFVLGENQSGRLTSTVEFLREATASRPPPGDWLYVNNYTEPSHPVSVFLPAGKGREFCTALKLLLNAIAETLNTAFGGDAFQTRIQSEGEAAQNELNDQMNVVQQAAKAQGLEIVQSPNGPVIVVIDEQGQQVPPTNYTADRRFYRGVFVTPKPNALAS